MSNQRLFSNGEIYNVLEHQKAEVKKEVYALESNYLLNASETDLIQWLVDKLRLDVPEIQDSGIHVANYEETKVDVSRDPMRGIYDRSQPFYIPGTKTVIAIPFTGDAGFFDISPSTYSSGGRPGADIVGNELHLTYEQAEANGEAIKAQYTRTVSEIKQNLGWLSGVV